MVTKQNNRGEPEEKTGRVNLGKLKLDKETVKDLTDSEAKQIKGGADALGYTKCVKSGQGKTDGCQTG